MKSWDEYFMDMAALAATRSKDPSTKVGCVIVNQQRIILSTGYNGLPRFVCDEPERMERPQKYLWTSHAEENAVAQAARVGVALDKSFAYVTHMPCARCARSLIQAGVRHVCIGSGTTSMPQEEFDVAHQMFSEAFISVEVL
jgi:dCMP deaminase